ncbi:hypothetical protein H4R33_005089 [Dimargaris cristalligena]|nr:hypothetical protein H4R33_005089 [Dimargaris cristalligena]
MLGESSALFPEEATAAVPSSPALFLDSSGPGDYNSPLATTCPPDMLMADTTICIPSAAKAPAAPEFPPTDPNEPGIFVSENCPSPTKPAGTYSDTLIASLSEEGSPPADMTTPTTVSGDIPSAPEMDLSLNLNPSLDLAQAKAKADRRKTCDIRIPEEWAMQFDEPSETTLGGAHLARSPSAPEPVEAAHLPKPNPNPESEDRAMDLGSSTEPSPLLEDQADSDVSVDEGEIRPFNRRKSQVRFSLAPATVHTFGAETDESDHGHGDDEIDGNRQTSVPGLIEHSTFNETANGHANHEVKQSPHDRTPTPDLLDLSATPPPNSPPAPAPATTVTDMVSIAPPVSREDQPPMDNPSSPINTMMDADPTSPVNTTPAPVPASAPAPAPASPPSPSLLIPITPRTIQTAISIPLPESPTPLPKGEDVSPAGSNKSVNERDHSEDDDHVTEDLLYKTPRKQARTAYVLSPTFSNALLHATPEEQAAIHDTLLGSAKRIEAQSTHLIPYSTAHPLSHTADHPGSEATSADSQYEETPLILFQTPAPARIRANFVRQLPNDTLISTILSQDNNMDADPSTTSNGGDAAIQAVATHPNNFSDLLARTPASSREVVSSRPSGRSANANANKYYPPSWLIPVTPAPTLLDTVRNDFVSPDKIPKYSYIEMEEIKRQFGIKVRVKEEAHQKALDEVKQQLEHERREKSEINDVLNEYAETMSNFVETSQAAEKEYNENMLRMESQKDVLKDTIEGMQQTQNQMAQRYEELQAESNKQTQANGNLLTEIESLKGGLAIAENNFEALKKHAEAKIEEANAEIVKVRSSYDKDISILRLQLTKSESKIKTLEANLATKTQENADLMGICDELLVKIGDQ